MIKAAFFDLDDTLCDDTAAWRYCARAAATLAVSRYPEIDVDSLASAFLAISEKFWSTLDYANEKRSLMTLRSEQFSQALSEIGASDDEMVASEMALQYGTMRSTEISLFPDALATLDDLRSRGIVLACITNGLAVTHEEKVAHLGIDKAFDHVLIADLVGHYKPSRRIFEHALDLCGCEAAQAIMVGDDLDRDIGGAISAGIPAYWFNPAGRIRKADDPEPVAELTRLSQILERIELFS